MAAAAGGVLRMKLLIDTKSQRVVFAEAGKDVVDFLFSLLALPLATAVALVGDTSVAGSVGRLYASVQGLDYSYLLPGADRYDLLRPTVVGSPLAGRDRQQLPPPPPAAGAAEDLLRMPQVLLRLQDRSTRRFVTDARGAACANCYDPMTDELQYISPSAAAGSTVKGFVREAVTDDLTVTPMSTISSITLLTAFAVTHLAALQERTVYLGTREVIDGSIHFPLF